MLHPIVTASSVDSMCRTWRRACVWNVHAFATALTWLLNRRWSSSITPSDFSSVHFHAASNNSTKTAASYDLSGTHCSRGACLWCFVTVERLINVKSGYTHNYAHWSCTSLNTASVVQLHVYNKLAKLVSTLSVNKPCDIVVVVQQVRCSVKCTVIERAEKDVLSLSTSA